MAAQALHDRQHPDDQQACDTEDDGDREDVEEAGVAEAQQEEPQAAQHPRRLAGGRKRWHRVIARDACELTHKDERIATRA